MAFWLLQASQGLTPSLWALLPLLASTIMPVDVDSDSKLQETFTKVVRKHQTRTGAGV